MDLNSIPLTPSLVADLYANTLVETDMKGIAKKNPLPFLGNNQRQVLIVTASAETAFLTENELTFLTTILAACKLTIDDVAIINKENTPLSNYTEIIDFLHSKYVLLFGVDPIAFGLPIHFPPFQVQPFSGSTYLYAPRLEEIEQDKALKLKLWGSLKVLFGL